MIACAVDRVAFVSCAIVRYVAFACQCDCFAISHLRVCKVLRVSLLLIACPFRDICGAVARLGVPSCYQPEGGISDSSSEDEEEAARDAIPLRPLVPELQRDSLHRWFEMRATWDLLTRPDGLSVRALRNLFVRAHGPPTNMWFTVMVDSGWFEFFEPTRVPLAPLIRPSIGAVLTCLERVPHVWILDCTRPRPLGNPCPIGVDQGVSVVCDACNALMMEGGAAADLPLRIADGYAAPSADAQRDAALADAASYVARGGDVHLRCSPSCEARRRRDPNAPCHIFGVAAAILHRARQRRSRVKAVSFPSSVHASVYEPSKLASMASSAPQQFVSFSRMHVRRAVPPLDMHLHDVRARPSSQLRAAVEQAPRQVVAAERGVDLIPSSAFVGAATRPRVAAVEAPTPFSHRRLEPSTAGELLVMPFPLCNMPTVAPREDPPPADQPYLVAYDINEIIRRKAVRQLQQWARRADRSIVLAQRGDARAARAARPDDLRLSWHRNTREAFRGVRMDLTVYPFRSLQPSRWPDRPPSADVDIRRFRREFRAHAGFGDRQLRGLISHGEYCGEPSHPISFYAAPHGSAYVHVEQWLRQTRGERERGWGRANFLRSGGFSHWPQRCCPTSMVERKGSWRLCHDLSWPHPDMVEGVMSPNAEDAPIMIVTFVRVTHLGRAIAIMMLAGLPVKVWKFDLSKAYKRLGQQRASHWRRTTWSDQGSQTLDRVPFGGADGPSFFTRHSNFIIFVIRREIEYADQCYPPRDARVVAYQLARLAAACAAGAEDLRAWMALAFVMCFIDDFGAASADDLLFRVDGSAVLDAQHRQRTRSWLHYEVATSVVFRLGHVLELDDPTKATRPSSQMVLIGVELLVSSLEIALDSEKRVAYVEALLLWLSKPIIPVARLTSLAFKMLVVCESYPTGRQWLNPIFRALRGARSHPIVLAAEGDVECALRRFLSVLQSDARLAVPMAARESFPFADVEALLVYFGDASGEEQFPVVGAPSHVPGTGAWCVRGNKLFCFWDVFSPDEVAALSINALELVTMVWAEAVFSAAQPKVSHVLAFTDNTSSEWAARRETPHSLALQLLVEYRSAFLQRASLYVRSGRVTSADNRWADMLSRQRVAEVLAEAVALGLEPVRLHIPAPLRDLSWLLLRVA